MIDPKELMIGNWILDHAGVPRQVVLVCEGLIKLDLQNGGGVQRYEDDPILSPHIKFLKPIELTEKWLIDLQFGLISKPDEIPTYRIRDFIIDYVPEMNCYWLETNNELQTSPIRFVHEIQNLHLTLTQTHLTRQIAKNETG